jgi:putative spermidine/putrescine transport system substrate-binding protein
MAKKWRAAGGWSRRLTAICVLATVCVAALGSGCGDDDDDGGESGGSKKLVINSFGGAWAEAFELGMVQPFEAETGIDVTLLSTMDAAKSRLAIESGNEPPEDMPVTGLSTAAPLAEAGLLEPIPWDDFDQGVVDALPEETKGEYVANWAAWAYGLCYDKRAFPDGKPQPSNWADYWDFEKFPGPRGHPEWVIGASDPMPEFPLLADGTPVDDLYPIDAERAFAKMDELRPHVAKFAKTPPELGQQLVDGSVVMEPCFTHRMNALINGGADFIGISFDQARVNLDGYSVWKDAPNKENAMKLIEFILRPENQARWARIGFTVPVHPDALERLPKEIRARIAPVPGSEGAKTFWNGTEYYAEQQDGETNYDRLSEQFKEWVKE